MSTRSIDLEPEALDSAGIRYEETGRARGSADALSAHADDAGQVNGTVRIEGRGDEAHLWIEQRVPWKLAVKILTLLKAPGHHSSSGVVGQGRKPAAQRTDPSGAEPDGSGTSPGSKPRLQMLEAPAGRTENSPE